MEDLAMKSRCRTYCRIEAVFLLKKYFPEVLVPGDVFEPLYIYQLLEEILLVLMFRDKAQSLGLCHTLHPVANHLTHTLYTLLSECKGMGGFNNSWGAFQIEFALEELFFETIQPPFHTLLGQSRD
ncbi:hypothetical protein QQF64_012934 [Cirrhinus molitorella]|uniref:Uncharacterized protein n=1 Tax=Cirrhinus molitorella TaxID=172907 RepID=A0ABR3LPN4_9TELE